MAIPKYQSFMLPLLQLLADGQIHHVSELRDELATQFSLSESDRSELLPSGRSRLLDNRVAWARTDLGQAGALESPSRGSVQITCRGRTILAENPERVDRKYLSRYPEFAAFRRRVRSKAENLQSDPDEAAFTEETSIAPDERVAQADESTSSVPQGDERKDPPPEALSFADAAEQILEQYAAKKPMHYRAITRKALELGLVRTKGQTPEATLHAQILTEIKRKMRQGTTPRFTKHGRGLVGLSRWTVGGLPTQIDQHNREARRQLLARLTAMPPGDFEKLVGRLLVALGFQDVLVTSRSGDGGIDVRGILVVGDVIRTRMAVQVKRWRTNVQAPTVQQVRGSLGTHDQGLIITTSDFSPGARTEAERPNAVPVALMSGEQLVGLLVEHDIGVRRAPYDLLELGGEQED